MSVGSPTTQWTFKMVAEGSNLRFLTMIHIACVKYVGVWGRKAKRCISLDKMCHLHECYIHLHLDDVGS